MLHIVYGFEIRAAMFSDYQLFYIDLRELFIRLSKKYRFGFARMTFGQETLLHVPVR